MCFCSFATGQYEILETQSVKYAIELLFADQIRPAHPNVTQIKVAFSANLTVLSMEISITHYLSFFLSNQCEVLVSEFL